MQVQMMQFVDFNTEINQFVQKCAEGISRRFRRLGEEASGGHPRDCVCFQYEQLPVSEDHICTAVAIAKQCFLQRPV